MGESNTKLMLSTAMKEAMRQKEKEKLTTIRMAMSALKQIEVDERIELDDARVISVLDKLIKQRKESAKQYEEASRPELAEKEQREIEILQSFLPAPLSEEEIEQLMTAAIDEVSAESMKDMGKVMAILKPKLQGKADMGSVSKLIKSKLS